MTTLEHKFLNLWMRLSGSEMPKCEYRFHEKLRWRFDFAWPEKKVAVEMEGGVFTRGGHTRGKGYSKDCDKYNAAAELGWRVLRYTIKHIDEQPVQVIEQVKALLQ